MPLEAHQNTEEIIFEPNTPNIEALERSRTINDISTYSHELIDETINKYPIMREMALQALSSCETDYDFLLNSLIELTKMGIIAHRVSGKEKTFNPNNLRPWNGLRMCFKRYPNLLKDLKTLRAFGYETLFSTLFYTFFEHFSRIKHEQNSFTHLPDYQIQAQTDSNLRDYNTQKIKEVCHMMCDYIECIN